MPLALTGWILWATGAVFAAPLALYGLHRLCLRLEDRGLLYYRRRSGGGIGNVLQPLDRMTRPSIEHIEHVQDEAQLPRKVESGEDDDRQRGPNSTP